MLLKFENDFKRMTPATFPYGSSFRLSNFEQLLAVYHEWACKSIPRNQLIVKFGFQEVEVATIARYVVSFAYLKLFPNGNVSYTHLLKKKVYG